MKYFICTKCGTKKTKSLMIVSRHTSNAYCRDEVECGRRMTTAYKQREKERKNA